VKLFNIGLILMVMAVIAWPAMVFIRPDSHGFISYTFYFCGLLELIGLGFVLIHIIKIKKNLP